LPVVLLQAATLIIFCDGALAETNAFLSFIQFDDLKGDLLAYRQRQPRVGRNPKTGSRVEVPSKRIPYFKPSKELRDLVNGSAGEEVTTPAVEASGEYGQNNGFNK
jgi:hypothetical protein